MYLLHQFCKFSINGKMSFFICSGDGAQWNNFYKPGSIDDNFAMLDAMIMLIVDTIIYMVIAWYVDNVNPGEAGVAQPLWFPFMVSYFV